MKKKKAERASRRSMDISKGEQVDLSLLTSDEIARLVHELQVRKEELRQSRDFAEKVLDASQNGLYIHDLEKGVNVFVNRSYTRLTGYTSEEIKNFDQEKFFSLFHVDDQTRVAAHMLALQEIPDGQTLQIDYRFRTKGGQWRWYTSRDAVFSRNQEGRVHEFIGTFIDVTERRQKEEELRASEQRLALAQSAGRVGVFDWDISTGRVIWSPELEKIFGIPTGSFRNTYRGWSEHVHPADLRRLKPFFSEWLRSDHDEESWEYRFLRDGDERWIAARARVFRDSAGKAVRMIGTNVDITERKRAEQELCALNQRLEAQVAERSALARRRAEDLRRLAAELTDAEHREQRRLAHLIHDHLQQLLVTAKLKVERILEEDSNHDIGRIKELVSPCLKASRSLMHELSPPVLEYGTLAEMLDWLGDWFHKEQGLQVVVEVSDCVPSVQGHIRVFLFKAVRELLLNVVKHSGSSEARITLGEENGHLILRVEDGGSDFDPKAVQTQLERPQSFGLFNIRERLEALLGRLEIRGTPLGGASFSLVIPVYRAGSQVGVSSSPENETSEKYPRDGQRGSREDGGVVLPRCEECL